MIEVTSRRMECTLLTPDFSQVPAVALQLSTKNVLSHLTNMSQKLHRKSRAGVAENSSGYSWQICITFAVEDLACLGILCFASYDLKRPRVKSAKVL